MNTIYFILFYAAIATLSFIQLKDPLTPFLIGYSLGQALWEVCLFAILIQTAKWKWLKHLWCTLFFTLLIIHFVNFQMHRLLDTTIVYLLRFFFGHDLYHVIQVFQAINMNEWMMGLIAMVAVSLPIFAIAIYNLTNRHKTPISQKTLFLVFGELTFALVCAETLFVPKMSYLEHVTYVKTLPLLTTLTSPNTPVYSLLEPVTPPQKEELVPLTLTQKPNLYLFVIETLRSDFLSPEIAPALSSFGEENIRCATSFSNANATQQSWFSIFHSQFPYHWAKRQELGSSHLALLRSLGYKIHVYSSADLRYFEMDSSLFGEHRHLVDSIEEYAEDRNLTSWERDEKVLNAFEKDLPSCSQGHAFIFFFDATHSEYSFPKQFSHFMPIPEKINYLFLDLKNLDPLKNRYRNAVRYIDSLMGRFFSSLKNLNLYDDAIIAITGDHGEEFFEEGALFHGTHLNDFQTKVPILFKFPKQLPIFADVVTHIDIFPTIVHVLTDKEPLHCDGRSIFGTRQQPFRLATLQQGAQTPEEFILENKSYTIRARFTNGENLYSAQDIQIISCKKDGIEAPLPDGAFDLLTQNQFCQN
jgi:glucan phosphoethanolaminetransferase (alkaline phosphatase superfamily)